MKKILIILLCFLCILGFAHGDSFATPTDIKEELVEFDDDDWGYIDIKFERKVYIVADGKPERYGDQITLIAVLVDFQEDDIYTFSWQYAAKLPDWVFIEDEHEQTYTFILNETNILYWYRVIVELEGIK